MSAFCRARDRAAARRNASTPSSSHTTSDASKPPSRKAGPDRPNRGPDRPDALCAASTSARTAVGAVDTNASSAREETNTNDEDRRRAHGVLPGAETRASEARTPILRVRFVMASVDDARRFLITVSKFAAADSCHRTGEAPPSGEPHARPNQPWGATPRAKRWWRLAPGPWRTSPCPRPPPPTASPRFSFTSTSSRCGRRGDRSRPSPNSTVWRARTTAPGAAASPSRASTAPSPRPRTEPAGSARA